MYRKAAVEEKKKGLCLVLEGGRVWLRVSGGSRDSIDSIDGLCATYVAHKTWRTSNGKHVV